MCYQAHTQLAPDGAPLLGQSPLQYMLSLHTFRKGDATWWVLEVRNNQVVPVVLQTDLTDRGQWQPYLATLSPAVRDKMLAMLQHA